MILSILGLFVRHPWLSILLISSALIIRDVIAFIKSPLRAQEVPGPLLARISHLYRFLRVLKGTWHRDLISLHEIYGPIVWVAPNEVSVSDPKYKDVIYSFASKDETKFFKKSKSFETGQINEDFSLLFEQAPEKAREGKKALAHVYSEARLKDFEINFDQAVDELIQGIRTHHVQTGKPANFYRWMRFYLFDIIVQLSSNESGGFCLGGTDKPLSSLGLRIIMDVVGTLLAVPLTLTVTTRPIRKWLLHNQLEWVYSGVLKYTKHNQDEKRERIEEIRRKSPGHLINKFVQVQNMLSGSYAHGNPTEGVTNNLFNLIAGGVGVTPNVLCAAVSSVCQRPDLVSKIRTELADIPHVGTIPIAEFLPFDNPSERIPILQCCIKEALRMAPAVGFLLSREIPACGINVEGYHIPAGYNIGMSGWPVHYNKSYFGEDADEFRPERWTEHGRIHPTKVDREGKPVPMPKAMEQGWMPFGAGARVCIGRHLAAHVMVKGLARLLEEFDIQILKRPQERFGFVVEHDGMMVRFSKRKPVV